MCSVGVNVSLYESHLEWGSASLQQNIQENSVGNFLGSEFRHKDIYNIIKEVRSNGSMLDKKTAENHFKQGD
jgi:hypothetical protein